MSLAWTDLAAAFALYLVLEGIMLNEHVRRFGDLPRHSEMPGSSTVGGWRRVHRMSPGPVAVLNRYGA